MHGVDIPTLKWPTADFPRYKYPLAENHRENRAEDARCLATVEEQIHRMTKEGTPVAGIMFEPIQAEGGDFHGSKEFFQVSEHFIRISFTVFGLMSVSMTSKQRTLYNDF